jgi:hypothetical protein
MISKGYLEDLMAIEALLRKRAKCEEDIVQFECDRRRLQCGIGTLTRDFVQSSGLLKRVPWNHCITPESRTVVLLEATDLTSLTVGEREVFRQAMAEPVELCDRVMLTLCYPGPGFKLEIRYDGYAAVLNCRFRELGLPNDWAEIYREIVETM